MKAIQITAPGQLRIVDVPLPEIEDDEVLVKVAVCTSCTQWDITTWRGIDIFEREGFPKYPLGVGATGHELAGTVVKVGKEVTGLKVGDRVAPWGSPPDLPRRAGPERNGGYAEYVARHERSFRKFPDTLPFEEAACVEIFTCLMSAIFRAGEVAMKRVAVSGMGPAGLLAIQAVKARGAKEVTAIDIQPDRLEVARKLGADTVMLPDSPEWKEFTRPENNVETAIDCIGVAASVNNLMKVVRGKIILFGVAHGDVRYTTAAWLKHIDLINCGPRSEQGSYYAAHMLSTGQVKAGPIVTHWLPMPRFGEAVELLASRQAIKVAFTPDF